MRALLDTHAFLWWLFDDSRLSPRVLDLMAERHPDEILGYDDFSHIESAI